jgi:hypothetical protein
MIIFKIVTDKPLGYGDIEPIEKIVKEEFTKLLGADGFALFTKVK